MEKATIKHHFFTGIFWQIFSIFISVFSGFILFYFLSRHVSPYVLGQYAIAMVMVGFLSTLAEFGFGSSLVHSIEINQKKINATTLVSSIACFTIVLLILLLHKQINGFIDIDFEKFKIYLMLIFIFRTYTMIPRSLLIRQFGFKKIAIIDNITVFINLFFSIGLVYLGYGLLALIITQLICGIVAFLLMSYSAKFHYGILTEKKYVKEIFHYGGRLTLVNTLSIISIKVDKVIIGKICGLYAVGIFERIQYLFDNVLKMLGSAFDSVLFSSLAKTQKDAAATQKIFLHFLEVMLFYLTVGIFLLINNSTLIMQIVLGKKWNGYTVLFMVLSITFLFNVIPRFIDTLSRSTGSLTNNIYAKAIYLISIVGLTWLAAHKGINYASLAVMISSFIHLVAMLIIAVNQLQVSWKKIGVVFYTPIMFFLLGESTLFIFSFLLAKTGYHQSVEQIALSIFVTALYLFLFFNRNWFGIKTIKETTAMTIDVLRSRIKKQEP